ncbi:hypothetical protein Tco_0327703 [Tanacetum coccineum]
MTTTRAAAIDRMWRRVLREKGLSTEGADKDIVPLKVMSKRESDEWVGQQRRILGDYGYEEMMNKKAEVILWFIPYEKEDTLIYPSSGYFGLFPYDTLRYQFVTFYFEDQSPLAIGFIFMDTAYVDSMDTPYWELVKRVLGQGTTSLLLTEQVNSIQQLLAYYLITGTEGLPSTASNEGTAKITPCTEGPLRDKDSEGNIPPADMEPINPTITDPSGTGAEYQVDKTQSTRLRYQTLTENKGKTSSKVDPGLQTLQFTTFADIQAYLLSEDELNQESDEEEVFAAGDDMEEETQADEEEHQSPSPNKDKPEPSHTPTTQESDSDSSSPDLNKFNNILPLTERQLVKYLRKDTVKYDHVLSKKDIEATKAYTKNSSTLTELLSLSSNSLAWNLGPRMTAVESSQAAIKSDISSLKQDTSVIKSMMSEIYQAFKGQASTPLSSVPLTTLAITELPATVGGIMIHRLTLKNLLLTLRGSIEGKAIATIITEVSTKLVPASKEVRPDPDAPILMPYEINGKNFQHTEEQIQAGKFNGMSIEINKKKELQQLEQAANLSTYTTKPSRRFNFYDDDDYEESTIPLNEIVSQIPSSIAITPVLLTIESEDSLIMGGEELSTIPEKKSDEFIKSSVEDLVPIPSESEDTSGSDSECDLSSCNDFSPINVSEEKSVTFSNPLFNSNDDFTSSDDESLSDEDVPKDNTPMFLNKPDLLVTPLFKLNEDECFDPGGDVDEIELLLHRDPSTPKINIASILEGFIDEPPHEENDDLFNLEYKENE